MRKFFLLTATAMIVVLLAWFAIGETQDQMSAIDDLYAKRNGTGQFARQSLTLAEQAFANGGGFEAAWRVARACFWICDRSEDKKVDVEFGKKGW